jgi:hypothetical protein
MELLLVQYVLRRCSQLPIRTAGTVVTYTLSTPRLEKLKHHTPHHIEVRQLALH